MKHLSNRAGAGLLALVLVASLLPACGGDVDFCSNPGGQGCPDDDDEAAPAYSLDFAVPTAGRFGALQLDITHLGDSGGFIGRDDKVDCVSLIEAIVASNYLGELVIKIGLISLQGIRTPAAIMRCGFRTREELSPESFRIEVTDASDTNSEQVDPPPTVVISTITPRQVSSGD